MPRLKNAKPSTNGHSDNGQYKINEAIANMMTTRSQALRKLLDSDNRDLDREFGYPQTISTADYVRLFERCDVAERVVSIFPDECWTVDPEVYEKENPKVRTPFEKSWQKLVEDHMLYHFLHRIDVMSGIGNYGILLLGLDDGKDLREPAMMDRGREKQLLYVRPYKQSEVDISKYDTSPNSPRYGQPEEYNIHFGSADVKEGVGLPETSVTVNWTRVHHVADNLESSQVFGKPRMRPVYNRLLDVRKLLGASSEMFWRGALPGYAFEVNPEFAAAAGLDQTEEGKAFKEGMRAEFQEFQHGLQRYMALVGVQAKSLAPQVADPQYHVDAQLRAIAITLGIPYRMFLGSEEGKLASSQDLRVWHRRLKKRQERYLSSLLIKPLVNRLVSLRVLPKPRKLFVWWPDLDVQSEQDKADVADKVTTAMQKYVTGNVEMLIPPLEYLTDIMGMPIVQAERIVAAAKAHKPMLVPPVGPDGKPAQAGGASNMKKGKPAGGQNPRNPAKDRSRSGGGASGNT